MPSLVLALFSLLLLFFVSPFSHAAVTQPKVKKTVHRGVHPAAGLGMASLRRVTVRDLLRNLHRFISLDPSFGLFYTSLTPRISYQTSNLWAGRYGRTG